jgi:hypothetical protein
MTWQRYDEAIEVIQKRFQYFPQIFRWRGGHYSVQEVERCWTASRTGWRRQATRHFFRLRCPEGTFELYQDLRANTWHLGRAMLGASSGSPARHHARA